MKETQKYISNNNKVGLCFSYFYTINLIISFTSKYLSINNVIKNQYLTISFPETYKKIEMLELHTIFGEIGYKALFGIILIITIFAIAQFVDKKNQLLSKKSFILSGILYSIAIIIPCIILRGNGFINYIQF